MFRLSSCLLALTACVCSKRLIPHAGLVRPQRIVPATFSHTASRMDGNSIARAGLPLAKTAGFRGPPPTVLGAHDRSRVVDLVSRVPFRSKTDDESIEPSVEHRGRDRLLVVPRNGISHRRSLLLGLSGVAAATFQNSFIANAATTLERGGQGLVANLKGKTACVTGASRGIGKGIAVGLGEAGATVFVTGRRQEAIERTAKLVTDAGGIGVPILCDHSDDAQVEKAFREIASQTGGKLDILVNNAWQDPGARDPKTDALLSAGAKFYELPLQVWDDVHRVGLRSHYVASYYAAPLLKMAATPNWRPLIAMISAPAAITYYFAVAYGVGKAATDRLARDLQVELGPIGIDSISIWPGVVYTETVQRLYETNDVERLNRVTGGMDPNDITESPLLTGRVIAKFGADASLRKEPFLSPDGLTGRVSVVAEGAQAFGIRDGGLPGTTAASLYGPDRKPPPSIRSAGYLGPVLLKANLPDNLKWLAEANGPFATTFRDVRIPFELMARDPRNEDPRNEKLEKFTDIALGRQG